MTHLVRARQAELERLAVGTSRRVPIGDGNPWGRTVRALGPGRWVNGWDTRRLGPGE